MTFKEFFCTKIIRCAHERHHFSFTFFSNQIKIKAILMELTIKVNHAPITFTATPINDDGTDGKIESGTQEYTSSNPDVATVTEDPNDETKGTVTLTGASGDFDLVVKGDADLGSGVNAISSTVTFHVLPVEATGFKFAFDNVENVG